MALQPTYSGSTYVEIANEVFDAVAKENGTAPVPTTGGVRLPALANGQLLALVRAWLRAAARSSAPAWPIAYTLSIEALGWHGRGDKFDMSIAHASAPAPVALVETFWAAVSDIAHRLDGSKTKLNPLIVDWSRASYEQSARDMWHQMQVEHPGDANAIVASPSAPIRKPSVEAPRPSGGGGWGSAILLIGLILAASTKRRKKGS